MSDEHKTFSMRLAADLLERIDHNANQQGLTRTAYVLAYLPEAYDEAPHIAPDTAAQRHQADR